MPAVQREPKAPDAKAPAKPAVDKAKMTAVEQSMAAVATRANGRADLILKSLDGCLTDIRRSLAHLRESNANYKVAYGKFKAKLGEADAEYEFDQAVEEAVQGLLIAAALGVIAPEALAFAAYRASMMRMMASTSVAVSRVGTAGVNVAANVVIAGERAVGGVGGLVGEGFEQLTGGGVDQVQEWSSGKESRPSDTAAGAGPSSGDKYEEAFSKLGDLLGQLPNLGAPARSQKDLAMAAKDVSLEAVRLAGGGVGRWTEAELEEKARILSTEDSGIKIEETIFAMNLGINSMAMVITGVAIPDPATIERRLWLAWMANLQNSEPLDNDVIYEYLGPRGLGLMRDVGWYHSDAEQREQVAEAKADWEWEQAEANRPAE